ncbi:MULTISPECIES: hypothetical protein [Sphingomonas]|jgi:hypothetical protein|uniref:hypothetical protein n=1 Tax=Sphingomonas TaxID=13687 RepID=UPI00234F0D20|nr:MULTISPECIES: hypothetical protein [Sphingomonas]WCP72188.1 hypothetical protein PPZ50_01040 [Sphingomonas hankookensis]
MPTPTIEELLTKNGDLFAAMEREQLGWSMILSGTANDPNSYDEAGGKTGPLGYYPLTDANGAIHYRPCIARIRAMAETPSTAVSEAVQTLANARLERTSLVNGSATMTLTGNGATTIQLGGDMTYTGRLDVTENGLAIHAGVISVSDTNGIMRVRIGRR